MASSRARSVVRVRSEKAPACRMKRLHGHFPFDVDVGQRRIGWSRRRRPAARGERRRELRAARRECRREDDVRAIQVRPLQAHATSPPSCFGCHVACVACRSAFPASVRSRRLELLQHPGVGVVAPRNPVMRPHAFSPRARSAFAKPTIASRCLRIAAPARSRSLSSPGGTTAGTGLSDETSRIGR